VSGAAILGSMADWSTAAQLATALGTLVLALATFVAVRAANRAARVAEYSMQIGIRPLLMPSRLNDPDQKIMWGDEHWAKPSGGGATVEDMDGAEFRPQLRDLYVPGDDIGFWQAALREPDDPEYASLLEAVRSPRVFGVEVLYSDHEAGQRAIGRFALAPFGDRWHCSVVQDWNLDRRDPRHQ
jgi:hypothetical protein